MNETLKDTPLFPQESYRGLPPLLIQATEHFTDKRERDVVLLSSLVILSGCFPKVSGKYNNDWVSPNLYAFIVAPPASAKGSMRFGKMLGQRIQADLLIANKAAKAEYESEFKLWNKLDIKKLKGATKPPTKPKYPVHFIPGNSSAAAIYKLLDESDGRGTICESEADTLAGAIQQDWGNFSHMLRAAFHHEEVACSRSSGDTYLTIPRPYLSTLLSGTPEQVPRLISSAEDGLSSRFLYYCFSRELEWLNPAPIQNGPDLVGLFDDLSLEVQAIRDELLEGTRIFSLSPIQFERLNEYFVLKLERIKMFDGEGAASAVYRLGGITFRIAMILTVLRVNKNLCKTQNLECADSDFDIALQLINVLFEHSMIMYAHLPKQNQKFVNPRIAQLYTLLPEKEPFPRKKANEIGKEIGVSEKSVGNYLSKLVELGHVTIPTYGMYQKKAS